MTNSIHPNSRSSDSHAALFYFQSQFTWIDPTKLSKKECKNMRISVVAEFNCAQMKMGRKMMGASTYHRHLEEHFPCISICLHKEIYCDKCKVLGTDMSPCRFVIRHITQCATASLPSPNTIASYHFMTETFAQH